MSIPKHRLFFNKKNTLIIDEPDLSLHPSMKKNLMKILIQESKNRQIII